MPLIEIRSKLHPDNKRAVLKALREELPVTTAIALTSPEGGRLLPDDIMLEFSDMSPDDLNCKDIHVRVWAHDYPTRREKLDEIRKKISGKVVKCLPSKDTSWYVWVLLAPTSYGSDTEAEFT